MKGIGKGMTGEKIHRAIASMELVADWLDSENPVLRQIANQTFDDLLVPTIQAQLDFLLTTFPHSAPSSTTAHELLAMLVLRNKNGFTPDVRDWMAALLKTRQTISRRAGALSQHLAQTTRQEHARLERADKYKGEL